MFIGVSKPSSGLLQLNVSASIGYIILCSNRNKSAAVLKASRSEYCYSSVLTEVMEMRVSNGVIAPTALSHVKL